ncbi:hypothetical protein ACQKP8_23405 [Photobacterium alginatilyticum]|uniref:hypothetical protein n=1 Tax=Photobacterium alginatilyticum TaxID=1775171 RepID=UPI0040679617
MILDLDPQGSAGLQAQPKDDDGIYLTIADIALRKYTPSFNEYVDTPMPSVTRGKMDWCMLLTVRAV